MIDHTRFVRKKELFELPFGKPFEDWNLPKEFDVLRRRFVAAAGKKLGTRQYIKVLRLLENHTLEQLAKAVRRTLELKAVFYESALNCAFDLSKTIA